MNLRGRVLFACTVGNAVSVTPAVHAVFGLFLVPLSEAFGWPRASISVVLGILAAGGALIYPLVGTYVDGHGARRALIVGITGLALSIAALALTRGSLVQFYATFAVISVFGAIGGTPIFQKVVADWYDTGRGTALGISAGVGNGLGSVILPVLAAWLMAAHGWRSAYLGIALAMLLVAVPVLILLLRDRGAVEGEVRVEVKEGLTLGEAVRLPSFWLTLVAIASGAGCTTAIFSHVVPILGDRGFDVATGTAVVGVFALVTSGWQIATGRILDSLPTPRIIVPMYLMAVAGLALLQLGQGMGVLVAGGALLGIGLGSQFGALPYFIARYFGLRSFGTIIGAMYSAVIAAQGITPVLLDAAFDAQRTYAHALVVAGACLIAGALLLLLLPRFGARAAAGDQLVFHGA